MKISFLEIFENVEDDKSTENIADDNYYPACKELVLSQGFKNDKNPYYKITFISFFQKSH